MAPTAGMLRYNTDNNYFERSTNEGSSWAQLNLSSIINSGAITITPNAGSNLNIALSTTGDLAVNTSQLYVDTSVARIGIGTASPGTGTDSGGNAYTLYGDPKVHIVGGMTLIVPSAASAAQGLMIDGQNLPNSSNFMLYQAASGWTGNFISANIVGTEKFRVAYDGGGFFLGKIGIGTSTIPSQLTVNGPINLKNYTVATLPAGTRGDIAYVTDALAPAFLAIIAGGGAVITPVFYNGANWVGF